MRVEASEAFSVYKLSILYAKNPILLLLLSFCRFTTQNHIFIYVGDALLVSLSNKNISSTYSVLLCL